MCEIALDYCELNNNTYTMECECKHAYQSNDAKAVCADHAIFCCSAHS